MNALKKIILPFKLCWFFSFPSLATRYFFCCSTISGHCVPQINNKTHWQTSAPFFCRFFLLVLHVHINNRKTSRPNCMYQNWIWKITSNLTFSHSYKHFFLCLIAFLVCCYSLQIMQTKFIVKLRTQKKQMEFIKWQGILQPNVA